MQRKCIYSGVVILLMFLSCVYGYLIHKNHLFPFYIALEVYKSFIPPAAEFTTIESEHFKTDVEKLISIHTCDDIFRLREELINFIWEQQKISEEVFPSQIIKDYSDERYDDLRNMAKIDYIIVEMEFDLKSHIYHFIPENDNGKLVLFHQGHGGDFFKNKRLIKKSLQKGYSVAGFCMPLFGLNNQPTVYIERIGYLKLTIHENLKMLTPIKGHPVQYFLQPIIVFLNYVTQQYNYKHIGMVGISGGGWTTTVAAAVDPRISYSFPVAGTYPIYLRSNSLKDWGDWEQNIPELYKIANYLEMYILGAYGNDRVQCQIINQFDPSCFGGIKWQTYKDIVSSRVRSLGLGRWDLLLDDSHHGHIISNVAIEKILFKLDNVK